MNQNQFDPSMLFGALGLGMLSAALVISLIIMAVVCWLVAGCYEKIPEKFRAMPPNKVWLLMIPCFNLVWGFWVFPGLSKSFQAYFDSVDDKSVGDCYAKVALWLCISQACCIVPCLNYLAGLAALVLLILFLIKTNELKNKIK
jgi:hypothetical protein